MSGPAAVLLLGGSSDIGAALLDELLPPTGSHVVLAGRPSPRRRQAAGRLSAAGHSVAEIDWDATDPPEPTAFVEQAARVCGQPLDLVVVAVGSLGGRLPSGRDPDRWRVVEQVLTTTFVAPAGVVLAAAGHLTATRGRVVVVTSASAVRPRRAIAAYSVAKQALDQLCRQVAAAARADGVDVHVVRPGHVRTAMTRGLPDPPLTREPHQVAVDVARGISAGRLVIWSPPAMRIAMLALRAMPPRLIPPSLR